MILRKSLEKKCDLCHTKHTMSKRKKQIVLLVVLLSVIAALRLSPLGSVLTFDNLVRHRAELLSFVGAHYASSAFLFIVVYVLVTALSLPGAAILTLAGGFLFGTILCTLYVNVGATAGAVLAFLSARYLLGNRLQEKYAGQLGRFNEEIRRNGTSYFLTVRFIPIFPFFLINFLSGLTTVSLGTFLWTTSAGIIPGTAVYAFAGRQIGSITSPGDVLSWKIFLAFGALAVFSLVPVFLKRYRATKNRGH
jgi:uncharacterized membrane protein YdjX (TVP38/TMEM64 family)